jgi:hypothetical protein
MTEAASLPEAGSTERAVEEPSPNRALLTHAPLLTLGLLMAFHPTLLSRFRLLQTDVGDSRLVNFILEHGYQWFLSQFTSHPRSLWDQPFFFPATNVGAYSEILVGSGPIYWVFKAVGFAADTSLQLWMLSVVALDYVSMALFLRGCLGFRHAGAALGGFLFAFGSPRITQVGHQQLLPQFFTVFAFYGLYRFFRPGRMTAQQGLALFAVAFAAQFWAGFYLGWFLFFALLLLALWTVIVPRYRTAMVHRLVESRKAVTITAAAIAVLLLPMAIPYFRALRELGPRPLYWQEGLIHPQSWLYLGPQSWLYGWLQRCPIFQDLSAENEQRIGIGWSTLALAGFGLHAFSRSRGWPRIVLLSGVTMIAVMTQYPGGLTPWPSLARVLPAGSAVRALPRVILLLLIPLSIGLAEVVERVKLSAIAVIVCVVVVAEQAQTTSAYDKLSVRSDVAAIASQVKNCAAFYYVAACPGQRDSGPPIVKVQVDAMTAALETGVPTVNGYSGNFPIGWWELVDARVFDERDAARLHEALQRWLMRKHANSVQVCWIESPTCR